MKSNYETIIFGNGCFWCTEAIFSSLKGVRSVVPGYSGGHKEFPTYKEVFEGATGHAEVIKIEFDSKIISLTDLLEIFFVLHDPTTKNRQGNDVGEQYRSVIFCVNEKQKAEAENFLKNIQKGFAKPIVTEIRPFKNFYEAEDYHKNYYALNPQKPYCALVISPKLKKLRNKFSKFLKTQ